MWFVASSETAIVPSCGTMRKVFRSPNKAISGKEHAATADLMAAHAQHNGHPKALHAWQGIGSNVAMVVLY